jgi:hypothetical protein
VHLESRSLQSLVREESVNYEGPDILFLQQLYFAEAKNVAISQPMASSDAKREETKPPASEARELMGRSGCSACCGLVDEEDVL